MKLSRQFVIVPMSVSRNRQMYTIAIQIESRSGTMIKSRRNPREIPGIKLFTSEDIESARGVCSPFPPIIDLRLKSEKLMNGVIPIVQLPARQASSQE